MPTPQDAFRVLAITSNAPLLGLVKSALGQDPSYLFIDRQLKADELMESLENLQPNAVILDYGGAPSSPLELIDGLAWQFPEMAIVAVLPKDQVGQANRVILAGARAFLVQPMEDRELLDVLGRIKDVHQRSQRSKAAAVAGEPPAASRGTYVVFSPKGGVGCSLVASNLALELRKELDQEVLLMDAKLLFGDLDLLLNLKTQNSIADLVPHIGSLDEVLIRDVTAEHVSGLKVLAAPPSPVSAQGIHPEEMHRILTSLQGVFPNIVIDGGNFLNDVTVTLMDGSHRVLLVMNPDIASLRNASKFLELCRTSLSYPQERILLVVNQNDQREGLNVADIERTLRIDVFAALPWDPRAALQSINRGVPLGVNGRGHLRKAFQTMAKKIAAMTRRGEGSTRAGRKKTPEALASSSRLG